MFVSNSQNIYMSHSNYSLALSPVLTLLIKVISFQTTVHQKSLIFNFRCRHQCMPQRTEYIRLISNKLLQQIIASIPPTCGVRPKNTQKNNVNPAPTAASIVTMACGFSFKANKQQGRKNTRKTASIVRLPSVSSPLRKSLKAISAISKA